MKTISPDDDEALLKDDPQLFWERVDEVLSGHEGSDERRSVESQLDRLFGLCVLCYDDHLEQFQNVEHVIDRLLHSDLVGETPVDDLTTALVSLTIQAKTLPTLLLAYEALSKLSASNSNLFRSCTLSKQLIARLVHHFWAARFAEEFNAKHGEAAANNEEPDGGHGAAWNIKHIRSTSRGDAKRQLAERRDRNIQIKLREQSVVLLYEICRSQRLSASDIRAIDATFVNHLFELVEHSRNWHDDAYNYKLIKLIVALNEQFMVSGIASATASSATSKTVARKSNANASNIVLTVLRTRLNASKTFGENLIFMLNRASSLDAEDVCMQLLILKLLYLLFTTKETAHYFYTNDLKVLVDIFIRELSDLPDDHESLRHTYLRVLHPLLTNTQLLSFPYKLTQLRRLLLGLTSHSHLRDISATTQRLVERCLSAQWCVDLDQQSGSKRLGGGAEKEKHGSLGKEANPTVPLSASNQLQAPDVPSDSRTIPIGDTVADTAALVSETAAEVEEDASASTKASPVLKSSLDVDGKVDDMARVDVGRRTQGRVRSIDGLPSHPSTSFSQMSSILSSNARSDLGVGVASEARSLRDSAKRVHSSLDVTKFGQGAGSDAEEADQWSSSMSNSWHQQMADDPESYDAQAEPAGKYDAGSETATSSRTITGSTQRTYRNRQEGDGQNSLDVDTIPTLHVQKPSNEEDPAESSSKGSSIIRRRPPAPPKLLPENAESRRRAQLRKLGLHYSPSEYSLVRNDERGIDGHASPTDTAASTATDGEKLSLTKKPVIQRMLHITSTPGSPGADSGDESRANSPALTDEGLSSSNADLSGKRRKPPPPPIDRSTKSPRPPNMLANSLPTSSVATDEHASHASEGNAVQDHDAQYYPKSDPVRTDRDERNLSGYMSHLHLSGGNGYGW